MKEKETKALKRLLELLEQAKHLAEQISAYSTSNYTQQTLDPIACNIGQAIEGVEGLR